MMLALVLYFLIVSHTALCVPCPVKVIFEIYENMVEILNICYVVLRPALKPACCSAMIYSVCGWSLFRIIFKNDLIGMADKADGSVVLAQLQVAFRWECDN